MKHDALTIILSLLTVILTACDHKELSLYARPSVSLKVVYDWQKAPDASPKSMETWFFPMDNEHPEPIRYAFPGRDGGAIRLVPGDYCAISLNGDIDDWARFRGTDNMETFELYTNDVYVLQAMYISTRAVPRPKEAEDERIAETPDMIWNHQTREVSFDEKNGPFTFTFYPEEAVCHYTVTVLDVVNLKYLSGGMLDATISGMAEGFLHGSHSPTATPVTMPFTLHAPMRSADEQSTLTSAFLTFGEASGKDSPHILTIYMLLDDGSASYYTFDVTDQVRNAPDPHHVDIVVRGLHLPKPIVNGGGLHPKVEDWQNETYDLKM